MSSNCLWPLWFLMRILCLWWVTSPSSRFFICICLSKMGYNMSLCRSVWIYLTVCWASRMCKIMLFVKFGVFRAIISSNLLSSPFSLLFSWDSYFVYAHVLDCIHRSPRYCLYFILFFFFPVLDLNNLNWPIFKFRFFLLKLKFVFEHL